MTQFKQAKVALTTAMLSLILSIVTAARAADTVKVEGLIKSRNGETMILKTTDNPDLVVVLTDNTEVGQVQGVLKVRRKEMSMAALIPGLVVKVEATPNDKNQLVATKVSFKGDDLERAQAIQAGLHETQTQTQQNTAELDKQQQQISANKARIDAANERFDRLDEYNVVGEVTVYFANGKSKVQSKYTAELLALAEKAKTVNGYLIEVKGYTSTVGSAALNKKLSADRAEEVADILIQEGHIPLTRMLALGAMGESNPVGNDKTTKGQAQNRRVVVRILQNKGVAGI